MKLEEVKAGTEFVIKDHDEVLHCIKLCSEHYKSDEGLEPYLIIDPFYKSISWALKSREVFQ